MNILLLASTLNFVYSNFGTSLELILAGNINKFGEYPIFTKLIYRI